MYARVIKDNYNIDPHHYRIGLNTCDDGLYFVEPQHIFAYVMNGDKVCIITIPKDKDDMQSPYLEDILRSDTIIIEKIMPLWDIKTIQYLISIGADVHYHGDAVFEWAAYHGHLDIVQYLVLVGANITNWALCHAAEGGHLDIVKYLVSLGADIHADDNAALRWACLRNHLDIVQYLISMGAKYPPISIGAKYPPYVQVYNITHD